MNNVFLCISIKKIPFIYLNNIQKVLINICLEKIRQILFFSIYVIGLDWDWVRTGLKLKDMLLNPIPTKCTLFYFFFIFLSFWSIRCKVLLALLGTSCAKLSGINKIYLCLKEKRNLIECIKKNSIQFILMT